MNLKSIWWSEKVIKGRFGLTCGLTVVVAVLLICGLAWLTLISYDSHDILHLWETEPVVSIYIPPYYQGSNCGADYEVLPLHYNAVSSISKGACGCAQNPLSYQSSNASCPTSSEQSNYCMSLPALSPVVSTTWRESTICVKRGGQAAATYKRLYQSSSRPHPNNQGQCPNGYRKCGTGLTYTEGAICFPTDSECPITNVLVVASGSAPPGNQGWVSAGTFHANNSTLYVRREHVDELPVVDIAPQLTELTSSGENLRGRCHTGKAQNFNGLLTANENSLLKYDVSLPHKCKQSDPRYVLFDNVTLEDNFLQNLQSVEPTCSGFELYAVSDPRYNRTRDPDGMPCALSSSQYTCVRNLYQHTDCAAGDSVCAGVVHQNICGEYARAVQSAFADSSVTLGLYYAREIEWSNNCAMSKKDVLFGWSFYMIVAMDSLIIVLLYWGGLKVKLNRMDPVRVLFIRQACTYAAYCVPVMVATAGIGLLCRFYSSIEQGECTDAFTAHTLLTQLRPAFVSSYLFCAALCVIALLILELLISHYYSDGGYRPGAEARYLRRHLRGDDPAYYRLTYEEKGFWISREPVITTLPVPIPAHTRNPVRTAPVVRTVPIPVVRTPPVVRTVPIPVVRTAPVVRTVPTSVMSRDVELSHTYNSVLHASGMDTHSIQPSHMV